MKIRYQRRQGIPKLESGNKSSIKYVGYKDGFYYKETTKMWCWKQDSKGVVHERRTIRELRKLKNEEFIGQGNYDHSKNDYEKFELYSGYINTEEFGSLTKIGSKHYISMLLKRATSSVNHYDKRAAGRRRKGLSFIECLKKSGIEYIRYSGKDIYKNIKNKNHLIMKQKIWVFKNTTDSKIKEFKKLWNK